jgi:hypothetical protein
LVASLPPALPPNQSLPLILNNPKQKAGRALPAFW